MGNYVSARDSVLIGIAVHEIIYDKGELQDLVFVKVNKTFENLLHLRAEEIIGKSLDIFLKQNLELKKFYYEAALYGKEAYEKYTLNRDGKTINVDIIKLNEKYILTQFIDMRFFNLLYKDSYKYKILFKNTRDIVITLNTNGEILDFNEEANLEFGYSREELLSEKVDNLLYIDPNHTINEGLDFIANLNNGYQTNAIRKDETCFPVELQFINVEIENEKLIFLILRNVSEQQGLIDSMNKNNEELKSTLEILKQTQLRLMQEEKMAGIGQLSAGIAHEINNPLGFVLSNFNTLKKYSSKYEELFTFYKNFKDKIKQENLSAFEQEINELEALEKSTKIDFILSDREELFRDTEDGLERIRNIVEALRNFAHENMNNNMEEYNLNDGIKSALIIARNEIKYNSKVITELNEIPFINARGSEINQVILNMIVNSSQAIKMKIDQQNIVDKQYGIIKVMTYGDEDNVYFVVEDNGIGIPEKIIHKVYEPFFTTKPIGSGTGLGLSISYEIVKNKHHGEIQIESIEGEMTRVTVRLPIKYRGVV